MLFMSYISSDHAYEKTRMHAEMFLNVAADITVC